MYPPFRPPAGGPKSFMTQNFTCGCSPYQHWNQNDVVPLWQNISKVRPAGDSGGTHYTAAPFSRLDSTYDPTTCGSAPAGTCGVWLLGGDLNGLSAQEITDTVNDIMACAGADAMHKTVDHNCYLLNGSTDLRRCRKVGGQWAAFKKFWHGTPPWTSKDYCGVNLPNNAADSTHYLTVTYGDVVFDQNNLNPQNIPDGSTTAHSTLNGACSVNRTSGIITSSLLTTYLFKDHADVIIANVSGGAGLWTDGNTYTHGLTTPCDVMAGDAHCGGLSFPNLASGLVYTYSFTNWSGTLAGMVNNWNANASDPAYNPTGQTLPAITDPLNYDSGLITFRTAGTFYSTWNVRIKWSITDTVFSFLVSFSETYSGTDPQSPSFSCSGTVTLSDTYTSDDCLSDGFDAAAQWPLDKDPLRTDEELANAPLACFDEVQNPVTPIQGFIPATMEDYSLAQVDGDWKRRPWLDDKSYIWTNRAGTVGGVMDTTGGNIITQGMRSGSIVARGTTGQDRHFWFGFNRYDQQAAGGGGTIWTVTHHGDFSDGNLPTSTLRWQDRDEAQYDALQGSNPPPGNLPQSFVRMLGSVLVGAKFVQTRQTWPSVNFGRPYGKDLFAVDQTTVACNSGGVLTPTNGASLLTDGTYAVMVGGDGVYDATVSGTGTAITLGTRHCDIPAGCDIGSGYVGAMRWWNNGGLKAPPFGLLACAGVFDGTNTTFTIPATPYWLSVDGAAITCTVDLYLPDAGNGNPHTLLHASLTLTKATAGALMATIPGDYHTATWIIPHTHYSGSQFLPEWDDDRSKGSFVTLQWQFNTRAAQPGYTGTVPTWYDAIPGVLSCTVSQSAVEFSPFYPSVVGFVPFTGTAPTAEAFQIATLAAMPTSVAADDLYGGYWQGSVHTTMVDPFWQQPFAPDCTGSITWTEDDGTGQSDSGSVKYFPHRPMVEAISSYPTNLGWSGTGTAPTLPAGIDLGYDPAHFSFPPPYWPNGLPCGSGGAFASFETDWGFYLNVCNGGNMSRFAADYAYVIC